MHLFVKLKYEKDIATLFVKFRLRLPGNVSARFGWTLARIHNARVRWTMIRRETGANTSLGLFIKCIELSEGLDIFKSTRELCLNLLSVVRMTRIAIYYISKVWILVFILATWRCARRSPPRHRHHNSAALMADGASLAIENQNKNLNKHPIFLIAVRHNLIIFVLSKH